jgi:hypothetical protein
MWIEIWWFLKDFYTPSLTHNINIDGNMVIQNIIVLKRDKSFSWLNPRKLGLSFG